MSLNPFFSVSPRSPRVVTYDPSNPQAPYASVFLLSYGGMTSYENSQNLGEQYSNDEIILGYSEVALENETLNFDPGVGETVYRQSVVRLVLGGHNVSTENQYLLIYALRSVAGAPTAQFFVGANLVSTEKLDGDEQHALLLDCPGDSIYINVWVRLAAAGWWGTVMGFKGVVGYLL